MIKNFEIGRGLVYATVAVVPTADYFFVKNGEPRQIFCHCRQGGSLQISREGRLSVELGEQTYPPSIGEKVVLIRESNNPSNRLYTKAGLWVKDEDWQESKWAVNIHRIYRATAHGHRHDGKYQSNTKSGVVLATDTLINIIANNPWHLSNDPLKAHYSAEIGGHTLSYDEVRWERLEPDSTWTECGDPRSHFAQF